MKKREEEWAQRIAEYKASGKSMRVFCEESGIGVNGLKYWIYKRRIGSMPAPASGKKQAVCTNMAEWLTIRPATTQAAILLEIGEVKIRLESGFDPNLLQEVLKVVRAC